MIPGTYNIATAANATYSSTISIAGITTTTGYTARMDIRTGPKDTDTLVLSLTSVSGLTLSSDGSSLSVAVLITETQIDTIYTAQGSASLYYSLKLTLPDTTTRQYLIGTLSVQPTPTP